MHLLAFNDNTYHPTLNTFYLIFISSYELRWTFRCPNLRKTVSVKQSMGSETGQEHVKISTYLAQSFKIIFIFIVMKHHLPPTTTWVRGHFMQVSKGSAQIPTTLWSTSIRYLMLKCPMDIQSMSIRLSLLSGRVSVGMLLTGAPFHERFFHRNSNSIEN